jgi:ABC-2 type transport system permease protein
MSLRRVRAITVRILQQFRRDRRTIALLFVVPVVILSLLGYLLRGGNTSPEIGIVNLDRGPLAAKIADQLKQSSKVKATEVDRNAAEDKLKRGELAGYVLFPEDFSNRALKQGIVAPEVRLEGTQPGPGATVLQAVRQSLAAAAGSGAPKVDVKVTYLYAGSGLDTLDYFGAAFIGLVVFFLVFVVTSVSFLRERTQGTLERLMASPLRRSEIVVGYSLGLTIVALLQGIEVLLFSLYVLKVYNAGNVALIFLIEALMVVVAVNLGIFLSMFARTEFQAVQFIPLVIVPQVLLSGILFPVSTEPTALQYVSNVLPLTYAVYGLRDVMLKGADLTWASLQIDVGVVFGFGVLVVVAAALTLRRRIA